MFDLICRFFIKEYEDVHDNTVRKRYGVVFSIILIIFNILLASFKLIVSYLANSISIRADAFNNFSDAGSNIATLIGFHLSNKHPDSEHPYGHGRMEYVTSLIVSFLIFYMGIQAILEAIEKIIHPLKLQYNKITVIVLLISIFIKLLMAIINKKVYQKISSQAFEAASQDSINDAMMTFSTLVSILVYNYFNVNIDAYIGLFVSILVIASGIKIFKGILDVILGKAPDKELSAKIKQITEKNKNILGMHDLIIFDYGPENRYMSFHVEINADLPVMKMHEIIDDIEKQINDELNIMATIHMDPIEIHNKYSNNLEKKILKIVQQINPQFSIHDFRITKKVSETLLSFDVLVPTQDDINHEELKDLISKKIKEMDNSYSCIIQIDHFS